MRKNLASVFVIGLVVVTCDALRSQNKAESLTYEDLELYEDEVRLILNFSLTA